MSTCLKKRAKEHEKQPLGTEGLFVCGSLLDRDIAINHAVGVQADLRGAIVHHKPASGQFDPIGIRGDGAADAAVGIAAVVHDCIFAEDDNGPRRKAQRNRAAARAVARVAADVDLAL